MLHVCVLLDIERAIMDMFMACWTKAQPQRLLTSVL